MMWNDLKVGLRVYHLVQPDRIGTIFSLDPIYYQYFQVRFEDQTVVNLYQRYEAANFEPAEINEVKINKIELANNTIYDSILSDVLVEGGQDER